MHFSKLFVGVALILVGQYPSHSQAQGSTEKRGVDPLKESKHTEDLQAPAIEGQWSKPVNGIRMMAKHLQPTSSHNELQLLVFTQNCLDKPIALPANLALVPEVLIKCSKEKSLERFLGGGNLLVTAEPMDGQASAVKRNRQQHRQLSEVVTPLKPGEIRMHAIRLTSAEEPKKLQQQDTNQINNESVHWPELSSPQSKGRWKIHLSWRPDEQFPVPDGALVEQREIGLPAIWKNVQIDLPPLELDWQPNEITRNGP